MAPPRSYGGATATAIAPVTAVPTTLPHLSLWNGELQGGKTYVITSVAFTGIAAATGAAIIEQLVAHVCPGQQPIISGTAAKGPLPIDGLIAGSSPSRALVASAVTLTANQAGAGVWHAVGPAFNSQAMTATIGGGTWVNTNGIYFLPPGGIFSLAVVCSAINSATNMLNVTWQEVQYS